MTTPGRVGVIADDPLQGHLLAAAVKAQGYQLMVSSDPDNIEAQWFAEDALDLWVIDLSREDRWQGFLDQLLESALAPILFCDGQAPVRTAANYPKWERRLVSKLVSFIGKPPVQETLEGLPAKPVATVPPPREFALVAPGERPQRVWVLGASLGGPAAVKLFLDALPANLPVAFILAQHIDARFVDTLCGVLCRDNGLNCKLASDGEVLRHGDVAIAPVDYAVTFRHDGRIQATGEPWEGPYAPSIDQVIRHAGEGFADACGAILFSGMGNDGAIAAPQLAELGAPVWAQTADTCAVSSQPDSVRETGCVSFSGSPQQLARHLVERVRQELALEQSLIEE